MEDKKYTVVGSVTIGTDEYRDLVENGIRKEQEAEDYRSKFWKEQSKSGELQKELAALKPKYEALNKFVKSDDAIATKYKLYQIEQKGDDNE
jgi:Skp family chaperone for outer membrane proteins